MIWWPRAVRAARTSEGMRSSISTSQPAKVQLGEAGGFQGGLDVHAEVDDVGDELRVGLGLVVSAHDAEGDARVAVGHEGGNDGVERALVSGEDVGEAGSRLKGAPRSCRAKPVPGATRREPNSWKLLWMRETMLPLGVGDGEVGGVAGGRQAGADIAVGVCSVDELGAVRGRNRGRAGRRREFC